MNRENLLFAIIGLLAGYVIAFHLVFYINQNQPALAGVQSPDGAERALPSNEVKDRQRLQSEADQAMARGREEPENFDAQVMAAEALLEVERWDQAVEFLTRANRLRPDDYPTIVRLGHAHSASGRFDEAERWFKSALAQKPDDGNARSELALSYYLREPSEPDKAIAELRKGLELNPTHLATLHNLSLLLMKTGKADEAATVIEKLAQVDPSYQQLPLLREELRKTRQTAAS